MGDRRYVEGIVSFAGCAYLALHLRTFTNAVAVFSGYVATQEEYFFVRAGRHEAVACSFSKTGYCPSLPTFRTTHM